MNWLAAAIFASTVLLLVDRNHVWPAFWRVSKWAAVVVVVSVLALATYSRIHHSPPETLPANFSNWDK